ncbi:hypothetical protein VNO80_19328 [Phaseolus coccineus]|uniref:Uncharacterized protein n=1 Tax=Phaseolus coccineus TaxID=3886 RepID=A0AAN9MFU1_PHACN
MGASSFIMSFSSKSHSGICFQCLLVNSGCLLDTLSPLHTTTSLSFLKADDLDDSNTFISELVSLFLSLSVKQLCTFQSVKWLRFALSPRIPLGLDSLTLVGFSLPFHRYELDG